MTAQEIYVKQVKALPVIDRLQLARLIMDDLAETAPRWVVDTSEAWSDEDLADLTRATLSYAAKALDEEVADADSK